MADRHKEGSKSKYTEDRLMPGAFEGETVTRRRFMNVVTQGSGLVAAAAFTLPALGFALGPLFSRVPFKWQAIGPPADFSETTYTTKVLTIVPGIGEAGYSIAYVRKRDASIDTEPVDEYNHWIALSSRCMHLGCPVRFVAAAQRFICPCHGGVYDFRGMVAGGPPVRPLDRFYTRLNSATGLVEIGPRFSVNSELHRFSPRDPGQPLDGIGQYLYPARFDTSSGPPGHP
ncbi:MAG TPA: ubiquinol-cytochrome c reductase iron-sulfur subunit [Solirubrobacteraceae bacterium]|nr:ubiquinol-cytochrome c reductase iron-sulfur subunit [Solirubrobacteraceae bacterium]